MRGNWMDGHSHLVIKDTAAEAITDTQEITLVLIWNFLPTVTWQYFIRQTSQSEGCLASYLSDLTVKGWRCNPKSLYWIVKSALLNVVNDETGPAFHHERYHKRFLNTRKVTVCLSHFKISPYLKPVLQQIQCEVSGTHMLMRYLCLHVDIKEAPYTKGDSGNAPNDGVIMWGCLNADLEADEWVEGVKYRLLLSKYCLKCGKKKTENVYRLCACIHVCTLFHFDTLTLCFYFILYGVILLLLSFYPVSFYSALYHYIYFFCSFFACLSVLLLN